MDAATEIELAALTFCPLLCQDKSGGKAMNWKVKQTTSNHLTTTTDARLGPPFPDSNGIEDIRR